MNTDRWLFCIWIILWLSEIYTYLYSLWKRQCLCQIDVLKNSSHDGYFVMLFREPMPIPLRIYKSCLFQFIPKFYGPSTFIWRKEAWAEKCFVNLVRHYGLASLASRAGKGLTLWLLLVTFIVFFLLSHVVPWVRCGTWLYRFLIFVVFLTFITISRVVTNKLSRQGKLRSQNQDEACLKDDNSVYLLENTTQGSMLK